MLSSFSSALKTLTATTAMTLPDLAVAAAEAESVRKRSQRALAMITGGGRADDHLLNITSLHHEMIENGRRRAGGRPAAWLARVLKSCLPVYPSSRGAKFPYIWETGRIFSLYLEQSPREVAGEVQYKQ